MRFFLIILLLINISCSFDNKSGIWTTNNKTNAVKERFKDFETLYSKTKTFEQVIQPDKRLKIILEPIKDNFNWNDEFYNYSNNFDNFSYKEKNELIFKSKKLSRFKIKDKILFNKNSVIINDQKGNIIVYSIKKEEIIFKYNFYKKKFKKIDKLLNVIIENNIIYVSDNLGYLYALDYLNNKLLWAQNYKVPFRSNIKIIGEKLFLADINNSLYFIKKENGEKIKILPTEDTIVKNNFINSLSLGNKNLFFLNTYGSLYNFESSGRIKWFVNLNQSADINPSNLFNSNQIINYKNIVIVSTDLMLYFLDSNNGSTYFKISITSQFRPIVSGENLFLITKDNLLVCINLNKKKVVYSIDVEQSIANYLNIEKKKSIDIKSLNLVNNDLFLYLNNSYLVRFNKFGKIKRINKLDSKIYSSPIFIKGEIIYLDNRNKLNITN